MRRLRNQMVSRILGGGEDGMPCVETLWGVRNAHVACDSSCLKLVNSVTSFLSSITLLSP